MVPLDRQLTFAQEATRSADADALLLDEEDLKVLGLDDPSKSITELDWRGLYAVYTQIRALTPRPDLLAFTKGDQCQGQRRKER